MIMDDIESKKLIRSETKFIVPFSYIEGKHGIDFEKFIDSCSTPIGAWEFDNSANINHARYLLSHVNKDLKRCTNYHFQATSPDFYSRYHLYSEFDADKGSCYEFELLDVSLKFFSTGIGMIIFVTTIDDMNFFDYISDADKQRTARDVICFLYKINPLHVKAHLQDKENAIEIIEAWCKAISV
jgi:hypothetical protein